MSARRAVFLTLAAVAILALLIVAGYVAYRGHDRYQDALRRADRAEAALKKRQTTEGQLATAQGEGYKNGYEGAFAESGIEKLGWYVIKVERGDKDALRPGWLEINSTTKMTACVPYWYDNSAEVWSRSGVDEC